MPNRRDLEARSSDVDFDMPTLEDVMRSAKRRREERAMEREAPDLAQLAGEPSAMRPKWRKQMPHAAELDGAPMSDAPSLEDEFMRQMMERQYGPAPQRQAPPPMDAEASGFDQEAARQQALEQQRMGEQAYLSPPLKEDAPQANPMLARIQAAVEAGQMSPEQAQALISRMA